MKGPDRGASEQVPAARPREALDGGLGAADVNGAGRGVQPGIVAARRGERRIETAQVGEARREPDHRHKIVRGHVARGDLVRGKPACLGDVVEVDAVFAAIDHRNTPAPRRRDRNDRPRRQRQQPLAQRREIHHQRIVVDQQRAVGRHGLDDAGERLRRDGTIESQHRAVDDFVEAASEFDRQCGVAVRQNAGKGLFRHARLARQLMATRLTSQPSQLWHPPGSELASCAI